MGKQREKFENQRSRTLEMKCDFDRFHPNFEGERPGDGQSPPTFLPFLPTSREDMWLEGYLEVPPCRKGTMHLQIFMPSPGFEPKPYGTAVSVTNHRTGWTFKGL
ncbi:hypothetical protein TNCV_2011651 [Trichonephila clavipes]|nr:hypothetical protein TNCV_2011651 [Trichonephila clavipes]